MVLAVTGDEGFEATEPAYDAPPRFRDADERRMHARAYNHWASLQRGRALPAPGDLDAEALGGFAPNSVLLEIAVGAAAPALRFIGPRLREHDGLPVAAAPGAAAATDVGAGLDAVGPADLPADSLVQRLLARVPEVLAARAPVGFADEYASSRGSELLCRGVLMPLSSDGDRIDLIHGVISWKEVAAPELMQRLAAELGGAVTLTRSRPAADPFA
jgi:hypothetical protein